MVVFLLSTLLFLGGKAIVTSTNEFTTNETNVKKEVKYYNNFIEKIHPNKNDGGNGLSFHRRFLFMTCSRILFNFPHTHFFLIIPLFKKTLSISIC